MKIKLMNKLAKVPTRANLWDAGADLYSVDDVWIYPGARHLVNTGVAIELPDSYVAYVCPRSGLAHKEGVTVLNAPGVVDSGFRGEIKVNLINLGEDRVHVRVGDRIAQLVVQQVLFPDFKVDSGLSETSRGMNGMGSTGR